METHMMEASLVQAHAPAQLDLVTEARPCIVPPEPPIEPWERYVHAGARVIAVFLTLALALVVSSITIAVCARYPPAPGYAPPALEQVSRP
jgi:hypothetical protein